MEEKKFELSPVLDKNTGHYVIENFDKVITTVKEFTEEAKATTENIDNDIALKEAKKIRTDVRKKQDTITHARIQINELLLGDFNTQLKTIETMLKDTDKAIKEKIDVYNTEMKGKVDNKPKVITLTIKGYDMKLVEKVKAYALKQGLSAEVK